MLGFVCGRKRGTKAKEGITLNRERGLHKPTVPKSYCRTDL